jgi:hypothetical protein
MSFALQNIGGGQCYLAAKAEYLERNGWDVFVFSEGNSNVSTGCPIHYLDKFLPYKVLELNYQVYELSSFVVDRGIKKMLKMLGGGPKDEDIIIESHTDKSALWGEIIAQKLNARHFFITLYEHFRWPRHNFESKIDFYMFKMDRGELLCNATAANRLFEGYREYQEEDVEPVLIDEAPVQDVDSPIVDTIPKYDYNICYIGRTQKMYVPHIIRGVGEFAARHKDKKVQFVIVGEAECQRLLINKVKKDATNLKVNEIGCLHPLPKSLYSKIDVVIAGSGSARCSVEEGALTIVADIESDKALGLLGFDTNNSIYLAEDSYVSTYADALERALVEKVYKNMKFKYPHKVGVEECTQQNFYLMSKAAKEKRYYDEKKIREGKFNFHVNISYWLAILKSKIK